MLVFLSAVISELVTHKQFKCCPRIELTFDMQAMLKASDSSHTCWRNTEKFKAKSVGEQSRQAQLRLDRD
jgi:hypothetical protein